jgi:hypothetical protein
MDKQKVTPSIKLVVDDVTNLLNVALNRLHESSLNYDAKWKLIDKICEAKDIAATITTYVPQNY